MWVVLHRHSSHSVVPRKPLSCAGSCCQCYLFQNLLSQAEIPVPKTSCLVPPAFHKCLMGARRGATGCHVAHRYHVGGPLLSQKWHPGASCSFMEFDAHLRLPEFPRLLDRRRLSISVHHFSGFFLSLLPTKVYGRCMCCIPWPCFDCWWLG